MDHQPLTSGATSTRQSLDVQSQLVQGNVVHKQGNDQTVNTSAPVRNTVDPKSHKIFRNMWEEYKRACVALGLSYLPNITENPIVRTTTKSPLSNQPSTGFLSTCPSFQLPGQPPVMKRARVESVASLQTEPLSNNYYVDVEPPMIHAENNYYCSGNIIASRGIHFLNDAADPTFPVQGSSNNWSQSVSLDGALPYQSPGTNEHSETSQSLWDKLVDPGTTVEASAFETANSEEEYCDQLIRSIFEMEFDNKRQTANEEQTYLTRADENHQRQHSPPSDLLASMSMAPVLNSSHLPSFQNIFTPNSGSLAVSEMTTFQAVQSMQQETLVQQVQHLSQYSQIRQMPKF